MSESPDEPGRARGDASDRLQEEIAFHIEQQAQTLIRQGMPPDRARREARLKFGGVEGAREAARDETRGAWLQDFGRDVRYGARALRRSPTFAVLAILTLGLGIGASTALFSVVEGVLLRSLPYPEAGRLVRLQQVNTDGTGQAPPRPAGNVSEANAEDWRLRTHGFSGIALMAQAGRVPVVGGAEPAMARATSVSREFFGVMGVAAATGRVFSPDEQREGAVPTAVVSHAFRNRVFGGQSVGGATLQIGVTTYAIIGVMPAGFDFPAGTDIWTPRELTPPQTARTAHNFQAIARLADGISLDEAQRELSSVSRALKVEHGNQTWMVDALAVPLLEQITAATRPALRVLFGASLVLFVIACTNVTNLLVARGESRRQERALQMAIGASRWRLIRQTLAETLVLTLAGGTVGVVAAVGFVRALLALDPGTVPRLQDVTVNWSAIAFAVGTSLAAALAIALVSALRRGDADLRAVLADTLRTSSSGRRRERARQVLVVTQVALTLVLLTGTALLGRSFVALLAVEPGFRTTDAAIADVVRPRDGAAADERQRQWQFQQALLERLRGLPGVEAVGLASAFPLGAAFYPNGQFLEMTRVDEFSSAADVARLGGRVKERAGQAGFRVVDGDYFTAMRIPILAGRVFGAGDLPDAPHVAVVSKSFADSRWPDRDPIGRFIQFGNMDGDPRGFRVVGVVGDVREFSPETPPGPLFYVDYRQRPGQASRFSVVVTGPTASAQAPRMQQIVRELDPTLPVTLRTIEQSIDAAMSGRRFNLVLITAFGVAALALATFGTYGLITYMVQQRTREIGIRLALGAETRSVVGLVVGAGLRLALVGTAVGLAASIWLSELIEGLLFSVSATDPAAIAVVVAATTGAVLVASLVPAIRAARVSPTESLR